jgi:SM-20-related protein
MPSVNTALPSALAAAGWWAGPGLFDDALLRALADEAGSLSKAGCLTQAATGRASGKRAGKLRGDSTLWLDDDACGVASWDFLQALDALRVTLNRELMLGLHEVEAHFAIYPPGAGYARHRDRFRDDDARVLSLVCYLNPAWPVDAGGALRLHLAEGHRDIAPQQGTTVLFLSADVEHEVLPATRERTSIAAWFRQRR